MSAKAEALLDAHVQHELDCFRGAALARTVEDEVASLFAWLDEVRLIDVSSPEQVLGVIDRCVIEFRVSGGITEIAGESANKVRSSKHNGGASVDDVLPASFFEAFVDKVAGLDPVRQDVLRQVSKSDAFHEFISRLVQRGVRDRLLRPGAAHEGRWPALGLGFAQQVTPRLERVVRNAIATYFERNRDRISAISRQILVDVLDDTLLRDAADDAWRALAPMRLDALFAHVSEWDLEDFIVIGYELWLRFRKTPYFRAVTSEVVAHIFDKYGEDSVRSLFEDMGVDEALVRQETHTFLRPIVAEALSTGYLEARIRDRLQRFYRSDGVARILDEG